MTQNYQSIGEIIGSNVNNVNSLCYKENSTTKKDKRKLRLILVFLFLINSIFFATNIFLLCVVLPRNQNLSFDYIGAIIGILAILVTILIGWNIYSFIDVKQISKEYEKKTQEIVSLSSQQAQIDNNIDLIIEQNMLNVYINMFQKTNSSIVFCTIQHGLGVIKDSMIANKVDTATHTTSSLLTFLDLDGVFVSSKNKGELYLKLSTIKNQDKILNFNKLVEKIALLKTE